MGRTEGLCAGVGGRFFFTLKYSCSSLQFWDGGRRTDIFFVFFFCLFVCFHCQTNDVEGCLLLLLVVHLRGFGLGSGQKCKKKS